MNWMYVYYAAIAFLVFCVTTWVYEAERKLRILKNDITMLQRKYYMLSTTSHQLESQVYKLKLELAEITFKE